MTSQVSERESISRVKLTTVLAESRGSKFVSLKTRTQVSMNKTGNPYHGRVEKISHIHGQIGFNYQNSVNNQRQREGNANEFVAGPRPWGERIQGTPLIKHHENRYLEVKVGREMEEPKYLLDGEPMTAEQVEEMLTFVKEKKKPEVDVRAFNLQSIIWLNMDGHEYSVHN